MKIFHKLLILLYKMIKKWLEKIKTYIQKPDLPPTKASKFMNPIGFRGMDTQQELKDFQNKQKPTRPQAADVDLSKVLDDVLDKPSSPDQGLYSGKKK